MDDINFGVPAGWYPDPLGLPQLRWWDAQAWTEHTSEARAPIVLQPSTRLGFADDDFADDDDLPSHDEDLPSRREQRERERRENGDVLLTETETETDTVHDELSAQPLLAMTLRELEPPVGDTLDEETPGPKRASEHANTAPAASTLSALAEEYEEAPVRELKQTATYTGAVWLIAAMPLLQVLASIGLISGGLGNNLPLMLVVWLLPYLAVLGLAAYDRLVLQTWGFNRPASAWWAVLAQPGYLIARVLRTYRETGKGFAPIAVWAAAFTGVLVGIVAVPGVAISMLPDAFSSEIEQSVHADAAALGADLTVDCPPTPPVVVGDRFTCLATKPDGTSDSIVVSLQRENGWIAWRVGFWGNWVVTD